MPELRVAGRTLATDDGDNLLDALLEAGLNVPYSCRAGACHACMVRCRGELEDAQPQALSPAQREQGWRLACQCRVRGDLDVELFDPQREGLPARIAALDWLSPQVLCLRLQPERPLRYQPGQHVQLFTPTGLARTYSLASLPGEDPWLEFHIRCRPGSAFGEAARTFQPGDTLRLAGPHSGGLHYDPSWSGQPLCLLASGTGLAPLWAILRQALAEHHQGAIRIIHFADANTGHYLAEPLLALAAAHPQVEVQLQPPADQSPVLAEMRLVERRTRFLLCGSPARVEAFARRLFLLGAPRSQVLAETFLFHA